MSVVRTSTGFGVTFSYFSSYNVVNGNQWYRRISTSYSGLDANLGITPPVIVRYFPGGANIPASTPYASSSEAQAGESANVSEFLTNIRKPWERVFQAAYIDYYGGENIRFETDPTPSIDTGTFTSTPFIPAGYKNTYTGETPPPYGDPPFDQPSTPPPIDPDAVPVPNPYDPDSQPQPEPIDPPDTGSSLEITVECCQTFNKQLTDSTSVVVYLRDSITGLYGRIADDDVTVDVEANTLTFTVYSVNDSYFVIFEQAESCLELSYLDSPVRLHLSESVQGPQVELEISTTYFNHSSIYRDIGQTYDIDDEVNVGDPLYRYFVANKSIRGGLVTYQGETTLGRLANKSLYLPSSLAKLGPFTARQAFITLLDHFIADGATWLEYDPADIPEFSIQTSQGLYVPTIKGLNFKQGDRLKKETTYSARDWLDALMILFADEYKLRPKADGSLEVKAPYWAAQQYDRLVTIPETPPTYLSETGNGLAYSIRYAWPETTATASLTVQKVGEEAVVRVAGSLSASDTLSGTGPDYTVTVVLSNNADPLTNYIEVLVVYVPADADFILTGVLSGFNSSGLVYRSIYDESLAIEETRSYDLDWLYFVCEAYARPFEFTAGVEVWEPAYLDHEPNNKLPARDISGNEYKWPGYWVINFDDGGIITQWLPDPAEGYGRGKVDSVWNLPEGSLVDSSAEIEIDIGIDFYWSHAYSIGGGNDRETQHIRPEAYAGNVGFTYRNYDDADWNDSYTVPPESALPYTYPTIRIPQDGRKSRIRWKIARSPALTFQEGVCSGDIAFSYVDGAILIEKENYWQHARDGGVNAWVAAPRLELNAATTVLVESESEIRVIWGDTSEHEAALPGLADAKAAYPDRPVYTIDATNFDLDAEVLLAACEAFVRRHAFGAEIIQMRQLAPFPIRPSHMNDLYSLPKGEYGVLITRGYDEAHAIGSSVTRAPVTFRRELALAGEFADLDDSYWTDAVWGSSAWGSTVQPPAVYNPPAVDDTPVAPPTAPTLPEQPTGPYTHTVATVAALAALSLNPGDSVLVTSTNDTSLEAGNVNISKRGTSSRPITIVFADSYVLNGAGVTAGTTRNVRWTNCRYLNVWGGLSRSAPSYGWYFEGNEDCNFYRMRSFESYIDGFNLFRQNRRCKFYWSSAFGGRYGPDADGFFLHSESNEDNEFWNCEAAYNSDDGWDVWRSTRTKLYFCRAHHNGTSYQGTTGDGNGFKLGGGETSGSGGAIATGCLAWDNDATGFDWNSSPRAITLRDCVGWRNNRNFDLSTLTTVSNCYSSEGAVADVRASAVNQVAATAFASTDPNDADFLEVL